MDIHCHGTEKLLYSFENDVLEILREVKRYMAHCCCYACIAAIYSGSIEGRCLVGLFSMKTQITMLTALCLRTPTTLVLFIARLRAFSRILVRIKSPFYSGQISEKGLFQVIEPWPNN